MKRVAASAAACLALALVGAAAPDGPSVKEIMDKANKPNGLYDQLRQDLRDDEPMWPDVQKEARELARLAAALRKAKPPKGGQDSWDMLTKAYADNAAALAAAADKKDKPAAVAAHAKLGGETCDNCHKVHRPE
jgi:hypothetical protein